MLDNIPMPVEQSWFIDAKAKSKIEETSGPQPKVVKTQIPVLAGWFGEEEQEVSRKEKEAVEATPTVTKFVPPPPPPPPPATPLAVPTSATSSLKKMKHVDFRDPPHVVDSPEPSERSEEDAQPLEEVTKGKVTGNIALFQRGNFGATEDKAPGVTETAAELIGKGKVRESRESYIKRTSSQVRSFYIL